MEIGENVENKSIHAVQSVPILSSAEDNNSSQGDGKEGANRKPSKDRRVSFASSTQLTQYLEPINPFDSLGKLYPARCHRAHMIYNHFLSVELRHFKSNFL